MTFRLSWSISCVPDSSSQRRRARWSHGGREVVADVEAAGEDDGAGGAMSPILYVEAALLWRSLVPLRVVAAIIIDDMFI